jgi:hypothetical protein
LASHRFCFFWENDVPGHFVYVVCHCWHICYLFVKKSKVTMGKSPKQGWPWQWEDTVLQPPRSHKVQNPICRRFTVLITYSSGQPFAKTRGTWDATWNFKTPTTGWFRWTDVAMNHWCVFVHLQESLGRGHESELLVLLVPSAARVFFAAFLGPMSAPVQFASKFHWMCCLPKRSDVTLCD